MEFPKVTSDLLSLSEISDLCLFLRLDQIDPSLVKHFVGFIPTKFAEARTEEIEILMTKTVQLKFSSKEECERTRKETTSISIDKVEAPLLTFHELVDELSPSNDYLLHLSEFPPAWTSEHIFSHITSVWPLDPKDIIYKGGAALLKPKGVISAKLMQHLLSKKGQCKARLTSHAEVADTGFKVTVQGYNDMEFEELRAFCQIHGQPAALLYDETETLALFNLKEEAIEFQESVNKSKLDRTEIKALFQDTQASYIVEGEFRNRNLYVGNVPLEADEEGLIKHFQQWGHVTSIKLIKRQGFDVAVAYVTLNSKEAAEKAIMDTTNKPYVLSDGQKQYLSVQKFLYRGREGDPEVKNAVEGAVQEVKEVFTDKFESMKQKIETLNEAVRRQPLEERNNNDDEAAYIVQKINRSNRNAPFVIQDAQLAPFHYGTATPTIQQSSGQIVQHGRNNFNDFGAGAFGTVDTGRGRGRGRGNDSRGRGFEGRGRGRGRGDRGGTVDRGRGRGFGMATPTSRGRGRGRFNDENSPPPRAGGARPIYGTGASPHTNHEGKGKGRGRGCLPVAPPKPFDCDAKPQQRQHSVEHQSTAQQWASMQIALKKDERTATDAQKIKAFIAEIILEENPDHSPDSIDEKADVICKQLLDPELKRDLDFMLVSKGYFAQEVTKRFDDLIA